VQLAPALAKLLLAGVWGRLPLTLLLRGGPVPPLPLLFLLLALGLSSGSLGLCTPKAAALRVSRQLFTAAAQSGRKALDGMELAALRVAGAAGKGRGVSVYCNPEGNPAGRATHLRGAEAQATAQPAAEP